MRRFFIAAALGLGLLGAGSAAGIATAAPFGDAAATRAAAEGTAARPVHYGHGPYHHGPHRPHYAPAPRHWHHHHVPPRHHSGWHHRHHHPRWHR